MDHVRETNSHEKFLAGKPQLYDYMAISCKVKVLKIFQEKKMLMH